VSRLRRSRSDRPGITRRVRGSGFSYLGVDGEPLRDPETLERIDALVIPPAWTDVWICPDPDGHLQAVGVDAAGRRQYLYHERWRQRRDAEKFRRIERFVEGLPDLRDHVASDIATRGLGRERVLACTIRLLDSATFRIGNDDYTRQNGSFGLTTLRREHVSVGRSRAVFRYRGKSGVLRSHEVHDPDAVRVIRALARRDGGGRRLFVFTVGDRWFDVRASDVNAYLRDGIGDDASAKDFRTWHATVLAATNLAARDVPDASTPQRTVDRSISAMVKQVAEVMGNTPAVCRRSYIDPRVIDRYREGWTIADEVSTVPSEAEALGDWGTRTRREVELAVLALLRGHRSARRAA
jgi:DNA topoisomerase I